MIETVRARLTIWYVAALAAALIMVGGLIYVLLARALYVRIDENLAAVSRIAMTSLANDLAEGQDVADAARSTAASRSNAAVSRSSSPSTAVAKVRRLNCSVNAASAARAIA